MLTKLFKMSFNITCENVESIVRKNGKGLPSVLRQLEYTIDINYRNVLYSYLGNT